MEADTSVVKEREPSAQRRGQRSVIGVAGYARAGKDEVGKALARRGYAVTRFADELKKEVVARLPRTLRAAAAAEGYPGVDIDVLVREIKPPITRAILQEYGTEVRRADDVDYWVKKWKAHVLGLSAPACAVDVRYSNEADAVRSVGGWIVRVERPGVGPLNDHASENLDFPVDAILDNCGTLEDLDVLVGRLLLRFDRESTVRVDGAVPDRRSAVPGRPVPAERRDPLGDHEIACPIHGVRVITRMYATRGSCPECKGADLPGPPLPPGVRCA